MRRFNVCKIAAFTVWGNLSPIILISGPVIWIKNGLSTSSGVKEIKSPSPYAASSRMVGDPSIKPFKNIGKIGARPLGKPKPST
mmetsp:Transcript_7218/g.10016  ORF Transcript_7218/g.10016 Transcript_7218/m.10016 type:complete len:84 (+) Transcript_7218:1047-1298(+)